MPEMAAGGSSQERVLESIARGCSLADALGAIVHLIEEQDPQLLCSILLFDSKTGTLHHGASSRLPASYVEAIDGASAGPTEGSCGAAAALGRSVLVEDIATHPNWERYRELALPLGFRSCWSTPIKDADGSVLATFALYYSEPHQPTDQDRRHIELATHLASIALARQKADSALRESEQRACQLARLYAVSSAINETIVRVRDPEELYRVACQIAVEKGLARLAWVGTLDATRTRLEPVARHGQDGGYVDCIVSRLLSLETGNGPAGRALRTGLAVVDNDVAHSEAFFFREEALARGLLSCAAFPIVAEGRPGGVLCIYGDRVDFFLEEEFSVLSALAADLAFAVETARHDTERRRLTEALGERVKELALLHAVAGILEASGPLTGATLDEIASALPAGFEVPEALVARIEWAGGVHASRGFRHGDPHIRQLFEVGGRSGTIEVAYVDGGAEHPQVFLPEEHTLVRSVADMLKNRLQRDQALAALEESQSLVRMAGVVAKLGGLRIDARTRSVQWSDEARGLLEIGAGAEPSLEEGLGITIPEQHMVLHQALHRLVRTSSPVDLELHTQTPTGKRHNLRFVAQPVAQGDQIACIHAAVQEVTAWRRLESQLRQSQKMEAVGRLAGGVAHDFNNLLSVILSYAQIGLEDQQNPLREDLAEILQAARRGSRLTRQLLAFSRHQVLAPRVVDLNAVISDMDKMLRRLVGEDVEVSTQLTESLGPIFADPGQIEQIVLNLSVNARDAMPAGGRLTIETRNTRIDEGFAASNGLTPGQYVQLRVTDTGIGMDSETQASVFEPFFTTKEEGKGTGLGLATVWGVVKQTGGHICLHSEPGVGTTFQVFLPRVESASDTFTFSMPAPQHFQGTETVLVVEDDEQLRTVAVMVLRKNGYRVLEAAHPVEALRICESAPGAIDLLLTDVIMPRMSGIELAKRFRQHHPSAQVLYMSGYAQDSLVEPDALNPDVNFLPKPITPNALLARLRALLDAGGPNLARPS